jgi:hypothetical protein
LVAFAAAALPGLVLGGSACGGGGEEQVCLGIARELTLVEVPPRGWLYVAGGLAVAVLGLAALAVGRDHHRLAAGVVVLALAFVGLVTTARIDAKLGPEGGGTWGRADEDWGAFLRPALLDLRADKRRELVGTRQRPGAPPYEREQTLESFSALPRIGWKIVDAAVVVLLFASLLEVARRVIRRPSLALMVTATGGLFLWLVVEDRSYECAEGASDCYQGLLTLFALVAVSLASVVYLGVFAAIRFLRPRLRPPRT